MFWWVLFSLFILHLHGSTKNIGRQHQWRCNNLIFFIEWCILFIQMFLMETFLNKFCFHAETKTAWMVWTLQSCHQHTRRFKKKYSIGKTWTYLITPGIFPRQHTASFVCLLQLSLTNLIKMLPWCCWHLQQMSNLCSFCIFFFLITLFDIHSNVPTGDNLNEMSKTVFTV